MRAEPADDPAGLASLLEFLKRNRGFDFSGYKPTSLQRRIRRRMQDVQIERYDEYQDHLEVTPGEFTDLFNTILINVTGFFRDRPAWDYMAAEVIPELLESVPAPEPIRVWSAACATGEEAYTIGMVLAEALGEEAYRERVKIYATDVDDDALTQARLGVYPRDGLADLPDGYADRFFEAGPLGQTFRQDLRRSVIFGRNDLVGDAPISRVDLLVSRNALMYFTPETQARILSRFNFALKDTGFLFLGKSEMLITHTDLFAPHSLKWRVFRKVPRRGARDRYTFVGDALAGGVDGTQRYTELHTGALDGVPVALVLIDRDGVVTSVNRKARELFAVDPADVGRPFQDLELSYRPLDLRTAIERANEEPEAFEPQRVTWARPGHPSHTLEVKVAAVRADGDEALGTAISFEDVTELARLEEEHTRWKRQLEAAYEELQSTLEELETTNEELHSTNEELETTNEELQSSNEELETMNEELQSTNDELEAMNDEQGVHGAELDRVNLFLEGILSSLGIGVIVVDHDLRVQVWNASSEELWGLRTQEVEGESFLALDMGFPARQLEGALGKALAADGGQSELTVEAVNRRGRSIDTQVRISPLRTADGDIYGALLLMAAGNGLSSPG